MSNDLVTKEKVCAFYASDYHFEMITLPCIYKNLEEKKDVIILTENNLEKTIKILLSKMNFSENKKTKIMDLDWENDDLNKFRRIKYNLENNIDTTILIKGNENYIKNANTNLEKWKKEGKNFKIIDCYNIEEVADKIDELMKKYNKILKTSGEIET